MKKSEQNLKQQIRDIVTSAIAFEKYSLRKENLTTSIRARLLIECESSRLPNGASIMIDDVVKEILHLKNIQHHEDLKTKEMIRVLGFFPVTKEDKTLARRRLTIEKNKKMKLQSFESRLRDLVHNIYNQCKYRTSTSSWAGGEHDLHILIGSVGCDGGSNKVWSSNGKWSGNDSFASISIKEDWEESVLNKNIAVVDGMFTLDAELILSKDSVSFYKATWARQGRGFNLIQESGLICQFKDKELSFAFHATSEKAALKNLQARKDIQKDILEAKKNKKKKRDLVLQQDLQKYG